MTKPLKHRFEVLDSLRGIFACMVVLYHFHTVGWISNLPLVRNSWLFVDFFFVLSGFVITTAYRARIADGFRTAWFMWLRLGRIYPVHLVVLGLFLAVQLVLLAKGGMGVAFQRDMTFDGFFSSLTLTNAFFTDNGVGWNGPSWSIAVEMWTYLAFAYIYRACKTKISLIVVCAIIAALSSAYIAEIYGGNMHSFRFAALFRCAYGYSLGVIGAEIFPFIRGRWGSATSLSEFVMVGLVVIVISAVGTSAYSMLAPPMFLIFILIFAHEGGLISSILKTQIPLLLGKVSFSIYMIHLFVIYRFTGTYETMFGSKFGSVHWCTTDFCGGSKFALQSDAMIVPVMILVITAAYLLHNYVEAPCEKWAKAALLRRTTATHDSVEPAGTHPASAS